MSLEIKNNESTFDRVIVTINEKNFSLLTDTPVLVHESIEVLKQKFVKISLENN